MRNNLLFVAALALPAIQLGAQTISDYPYFTGFEGVEGNLNENFPAGWTALDMNPVGLGNQGWQIIKNSVTAQNAHTDSTAVHLLANFNVTSDDYLFTPPAELEENILYTFSFWYKTSEVFPSTEALDVQLYTAADPEADAGLLFNSQSITNTEYVEASIEFSPPTSGTYYFGFHGFSDPEEGFILLLDDVSISGPLGSGVREFQQFAFRATPNPASERLGLQVLRPIPGARILLRANDGRLVQTLPFTSDMDVSGIPNGAYLLQVASPSGVILDAQRLVVAH